jgi:hypothetical protein
MLYNSQEFIICFNIQHLFFVYSGATFAYPITLSFQNLTQILTQNTKLSYVKYGLKSFKEYLQPHTKVPKSARNCRLQATTNIRVHEARSSTLLTPTNVRRNQLRSVSTVCVRAVKTSYPLIPSSSQITSSRLVICFFSGI